MLCQDETCKHNRIPESSLLIDEYVTNLVEEARCRSSAQEYCPYQWRKAQYVGRFLSDAPTFWDRHYTTQSTGGYKDRHYLLREFPELGATQPDASSTTVLEVGCGVGSSTFPLLEECPSLKFFSFDLSKVAIQNLMANEKYDPQRCKAFVLDIVQQDISPSDVPEPVDLVLLIFVLGAISPDSMKLVACKLFKVLKPGGKVLLRDHGSGDLSQKRLHTMHSHTGTSSSFWVRGEGTCAFYFSKEFVSDLFTSVGFEVEDIQLVERQVLNRKHDLTMERRFIQGKFVKKEATL
mmetsp:Transcript_44569/g.112301  ORF Transcript_44569/g.112301 Transcript_44569/m.112301 type:complete len:293 (-) Transcript_44569:258-1136(-)